MPAFCSKHSIKQDEFERWLKLFAYTSKDVEDKRIMKETRWQFQPVRIKEDASSPTGLAFNGRDTICEVIFKKMVDDCSLIQALANQRFIN